MMTTAASSSSQEPETKPRPHPYLWQKVRSTTDAISISSQVLFVLVSNAKRVGRTRGGSPTLPAVLTVISFRKHLPTAMGLHEQPPAKQAERETTAAGKRKWEEVLLLVSAQGNTMS